MLSTERKTSLIVKLSAAPLGGHAAMTARGDKRVADAVQAQKFTRSFNSNVARRKGLAAGTYKTRAWEGGGKKGWGPNAADLKDLKAMNATRGQKDSFSSAGTRDGLWGKQTSSAIAKFRAARKANAPAVAKSSLSAMRDTVSNLAPRKAPNKLRNPRSAEEASISKKGILPAARNAIPKLLADARGAGAVRNSAARPAAAVNVGRRSPATSPPASMVSLPKGKKPVVIPGQAAQRERLANQAAVGAAAKPQQITADATRRDKGGVMMGRRSPVEGGVPIRRLGLGTGGGGALSSRTAPRL